VHPGQRIGKYVLGERIAVGGMAEVWAARAEGPQGFVKPVALKFILESFSGDPELEKLFVKEARIAAQLQHANLVAVFDFDKVGAEQEHGLAGRYYIAMEHVEGHDARRVAQAAKHAGYMFPLPLALYLAGEVLKGLRYVHERREGGRSLGLVHRDVSPHNVLVGFSGEVKLSDFGIAKSLAHSSRTKTGTIRGKICYASPEQLNGEPVDHRTDQFAMGVTLWEILAARPLFDGHNELEIIGQVLRCEIPPLVLANPERSLPPPVEAVVRKMLSAKRTDRYQSTADALSAVLALPGYTGDGFGLGDLVRTLFHRAAGDFSSTLPIEDPTAQAQLRGRPAGKTGGGVGGGRGDGVVESKSELRTEKKLPSTVETKSQVRAPRVGTGARPAAARRSLRGVAPRAETKPTESLGPVRKGRRWLIAAVAGIAGAAAVVGVVAMRGPVEPESPATWLEPASSSRPAPSPSSWPSPSPSLPPATRPRTATVVAAPEPAGEPPAPPAMIRSAAPVARTTSSAAAPLVPSAPAPTTAAAPPSVVSASRPRTPRESLPPTVAAPLVLDPSVTVPSPVIPPPPSRRPAEHAPGSTKATANSAPIVE
jgi:serine/threonine protein kinase